MVASPEQRAWTFFRELLDNGLEPSLLEALLRARYYRIGRGGDVVYEVLLRPIKNFGLEDIKLVTQLVEKHQASLTIDHDGCLEIKFPAVG